MKRWMAGWHEIMLCVCVCAETQRWPGTDHTVAGQHLSSDAHIETVQRGKGKAIPVCARSPCCWYKPHWFCVDVGDLLMHCPLRNGCSLFLFTREYCIWYCRERKIGIFLFLIQDRCVGHRLSISTTGYHYKDSGAFNCSVFKDWSRLEYSFAHFRHCQEAYLSTLQFINLLLSPPPIIFKNEMTSKTHKRLKTTLFNWTKQYRTCKFSRKSSFSSYAQHKNRKTNSSLNWWTHTWNHM